HRGDMSSHHRLDLVNRFEQAFSVGLFGKALPQPRADGFPFMGFGRYATVRDNLDAMPVQRQIEQHTGICRRVPDAQPPEYFERPHPGITLMYGAYGFNGDHKLACVVTLAFPDPFGNEPQQFRREVLPAQPLTFQAGPTGHFLEQCRCVHLRSLPASRSAATAASTTTATDAASHSPTEAAATETTASAVESAAESTGKSPTAGSTDCAALAACAKAPADKRQDCRHNAEND